MKRLLLSILVILFVLALSSCAAKTGGGAQTSQAPAPSSASPSSTAAIAPATGTSAGPSDAAAGSPGPSAAPSSAQESASALPTGKDDIRLEGTIGAYAVHMTLTIKDGDVSGSYYYDNPENDLKLSGSIEANRMLTMQETDIAGEVTGTFDGWYVPGIRLEGAWTNAKTGELLDFSLQVQGGIPENAVWSGEWHRLDTGRFASASLVIFNETTSSFDFQVDAFRGSHMGFIEGTAIIEGSSAECTLAETGAHISMNLSDNLIELQANDAANGYGGAGVVFDGTFTSDDLPEDTLLSMGYVDTESQDDAFRVMVGEDYERFINTANIRDDGTDTDGFGATVYSWWVFGFGDYYGSIVMFLPSGGLCAGVLDRDNDIIKVYTDDPAITIIPKTIEAWAEKYPELKIEFQAVKN
jgi:hypothetical protein